LTAGEIQLIRRDVLKSFVGILVVPATAVGGSGVLAAAARQENDTASDPWTEAETVSAAAFAKELAVSGASDKPTIVCVGFRNFYDSAHIPDASYYGPASKADGLDDLKKFAEGLPRAANLVIYCGCCPLVHCPNVRPAFSALHEMGFTHLRLLVLTHSFATDWLKAGYPVAKTT
jgi:hypothetical protein